MQEKDPAEVAAITVREMIEEGAKTHPASSWRAEDIRMHVLKAHRHLATFLLMLDGHQAPDGENHLKNATCRCAMALTNYLEQNDQ